jgi:hypothetical protein
MDFYSLAALAWSSGYDAALTNRIADPCHEADMKTLAFLSRFEPNTGYETPFERMRASAQRSREHAHAFSPAENILP